MAYKSFIIKKEELYDKYILKGMTTREIAKIYHVNKSSISDWLKRFDIQIRSLRIQKPGVGRVYDTRGYVMIWEPNHVNSQKSGYVYEHIKIMSDLLKRKIDTKNEIIHHIDGNIKNNIIENLLLMKRGKHSSFHERQKSRERIRGINKHGNGWKITISRTYVGYTNSYNKAISMKRNAEKELWQE